MKEKNAVYLWQISALVPELFKFQISVKYTDERLMMSYTQSNIIWGSFIRYINRAILVNLHILKS